MNLRSSRLFTGLLLAAALATPAQRPLANGVYAILGEAATREQLPSISSPHVVLYDERKYPGAEKEEPAMYVALDTASFVPLVLAGPPQAARDDRGRTLLRITLAREHAKTLEDFTRVHLNGRVAIVVDGAIVTTHKVRSVIRDGEAQITRCTDDGCESLRLKLVK